MCIIKFSDCIFDIYKFLINRFFQSLKDLCIFFLNIVYFLPEDCNILRCCNLNYLSGIIAIPRSTGICCNCKLPRKQFSRDKFFF